MAKTKHTAADLKHRITGRHPLAKSWVVFEEVCALSGSWGKAGSVDAIAVCLSAPRDFAVHGFEVKVSRSDWLAELNDPSKNVYAIAEVDFWWIVAPSTEIVAVDELPEKWGLYTCSGRGLRVTKRAKRLHPAEEPFSRSFVLSLLWKFTHWETPADKELEGARTEARDEGYRRGQEAAKRDMTWEAKDAENMRLTEERFEAAAGYPISKYNAGKLGALARCLVDHDLSRRLLGDIEMTRDMANNLILTLTASEAELKACIEALRGPEG